MSKALDSHLLLTLSHDLMCVATFEGRLDQVKSPSGAHPVYAIAKGHQGWLQCLQPARTRRGLHPPVAGEIGVAVIRTRVLSFALTPGPLSGKEPS